MLNKTSHHREVGSHHLVLVVIAVVGLLGLLGFVGYNSWQKQNANAGGQSTLKKPVTAKSLQQKIDKLKKDLEAARAKRAAARAVVDKTKVVKDSLISGVSSEDSKNYYNALVNWQNAEREYNALVAKAQNNPNDAKLKKQVEAAAKKKAQLEQLYKTALAIRDANLKYKTRLDKEKAVEPLKTLVANSAAADASLATLEKAEDSAYKTYKAAYDKWKKHDTAQNYLAMSNAMTAYSAASTAADAAQAKADTASNAVLAVVTTWPEYTEYAKQKVSLTSALAKYRVALKNLQQARKQVSAIRAELQKTRDQLSKLKGSH